MEHVKTQIFCSMLVVFIGIIFFKVKRARTKSGDCFGVLIICTLINLVFDMITVYTVNHLDVVSPTLNRICHDIFLETIILCLFFCARYIHYMIQAEIEQDKKISIISIIPLLVSTIVIIFGPLNYMPAEQGNYSYGLAADMCYASVAIYFLISSIYMIVYFKKIESRKRIIIIVSLGIFIACATWQAIFPTSLVSGIGLTLVLLAIFLTLESPDMHLIELLQSEKKRADSANEAKSRFLAQMSHEIRTPINVILGMDEMILREYDEPQLNEYAVTINNASRTLLNLVNDVLDFSKIEAGKTELLPQGYELSSICGDLIEMIKPRMKEGVRLITEIDETLPEKLYGDDLKVKQIIMNLLTNAAKYTKQGSITFKIHNQFSQGDEIDMLISVKDTGIGIKEEDIPKLFETFTRIEEDRNRSIEGTGLGMNIVISYLKLMGSKLDISSKYGEGTTFSFVLRQKVLDNMVIGDFNQRYIELLQVGKSAHRDSFSAPDANILFVDDNDTNRMVFKSLLKNTLMRVVTLDSGAECLKEICQNRYDIIFLDHMMPEMDGIETLHNMSRQENNLCKGVPVITLTANAVAGARNEYMKEGFNDYLAKPVLPEKLEKIVLKYLPKEKIQAPVNMATKMQESGPSLRMLLDRIPGLDSAVAIENCVSDGVLLQVIEGFCAGIDKQIAIMEECLSNISESDIQKRFTVEVHSVKSTIRLLGDTYLAAKAQEIENAGNAGDIVGITDRSEEFINEVKTLKLQLSMCIPKRQAGIIEGSNEVINDLLEQLKQAMDILDVDVADELIDKLSQYKWSIKEQPEFEKLKNAVTNLDSEQCGIQIHVLQRGE